MMKRSFFSTSSTGGAAYKRIAFAVLLVSFTGALNAQGNVEGLRKMDANGDGGITFIEFEDAWKSRVERRFKRLDTDGNGAIDDAELDAFAAAKQQRQEKRKARLCQ